MARFREMTGGEFVGGTHVDEHTPPPPESLAISRGGDVPVGGFCVGRKCDVPKDARYAGHYGDRYAWVGPEGVGGLARFTLLVLAVIRPQAGETAANEGLMFTP